MFSKNLTKADSPYKAVLIVGTDLAIPDDIRKYYRKEGHLLFGDGKTHLASLDYSALQGKIDSNTKIYIFAHGGVDKKTHYLERNPTKEFFKKLCLLSGNKALNIQLNSCFAGATANDAGVLPPGSRLLTHGTAEDMTFTHLNVKAIQQSMYEATRGVSHSLQDFLHSFALHVKQTATVSLKKPDRTMFHHTIRPPDAALTSPEEIIRYLKHCRREFLISYNQEIAPPITIDLLPEITEQEATDWRNDNLLYMALTGDKRLTEALHYNGDAFKSYINYSLEGWNTLLLAATGGHHEMVEALLKLLDIDVNFQDKHKESALMKAVKKGHSRTIEVLLQSQKIDKTTLNLTDLNGNTALMLAAKRGESKIIASLLASHKADASINAVNNNNYTALMLAAKEGHASAVRTILKNKPFNTNTRDHEGNSALILAAKQGHAKAIAAILASDKPVDINAVNNEGYSALMWAARLGHADIVSQLLQQENIDVNIQQEEYGNSALILAAKEGHEAIFSLILTSNKIKDINASDKEGNTALMLAAYRGDYKMVSALLNTNKINVNAQDNEGNTALMLAVMGGHADVVEALLRSQCAVGLSNKDGLAPIEAARERGNEKIITALSTAQNQTKLFAKQSNIKEKLTHLKRQADPVDLITAKARVSSVLEQYLSHSDKISFSIRHRHGKSGKERARAFEKKFANASNVGEANQLLAEYLGNEENGNTHPHSFRTMLLDAFLPPEQRNLKTTSQNFKQKPQKLPEIKDSKIVESEAQLNWAHGSPQI